MIHRSRVVASLVAAVFFTGVGALAAAPAIAADAVATFSVTIAADQSVPTAGVMDATDQKPLAPGSDQRVRETPVADRPSKELDSLILVAGLGVLFASILVGVRSGNRSHVGRD
jgi:hypothetical protein